jgi:hypothetical protein
MAADQTAARLRAERTLNELGDNNARIVYCREYTLGDSGSSTSLKATMHYEWVRRHDLDPTDDVLEFYDEESGALVILPKDGHEREFGGD